MPATEVSKARQNLYTAMMFMMRNFIVGNIYERMQNANDYIVKELDENGVPIKILRQQKKLRATDIITMKPEKLKEGIIHLQLT